MSEVRYQGSLLTDRDRRRASPWWGVHAARYRFALSHVTGGRVLDVACGSGYGLPVLKARAEYVVGVDADQAAVRDARREMGAGAAYQLVVADGCRLPFSDATFRAITSFETLEHLSERALFVRELRRVLVPDGVCVLSTPNANHTRPLSGRPRNPHHEFEYSPGQLLAELSRQFSDIRLLGQALAPRFSIPPFQDEQLLLPKTILVQTRLFVWRVLNKLPMVLREAISTAVWRRPFFPGDSDYIFSEATVERAPVQVAICRGSSPTEGQ